MSDLPRDEGGRIDQDALLQEVIRQSGYTDEDDAELREHGQWRRVAEPGASLYGGPQLGTAARFHARPYAGSVSDPRLSVPERCIYIRPRHHSLALSDMALLPDERLPDITLAAPDLGLVAHFYRTTGIFISHVASCLFDGTSYRLSACVFDSFHAEFRFIGVGCGRFFLLRERNSINLARSVSGVKLLPHLQALCDAV